MVEDRKPRVKDQEATSSYSMPVRPRPDNLGLSRKKGSEPRQPARSQSSTPVEFQGVYIISVAARILEMHPQTLRKYEKLGFISPSRTIGMLRLYSEGDIQKLRLIRHLEENLGLNLAGVEFTLELLSHLLDMHERLGKIKGAQRYFNIVQDEMAQLFEKLNLSLEEQA